MTLLIASFLAGALSVLAPCVVAFVPAIFSRGYGLSRGTGERRPWVAVAALGVSVVVFSVVLKSTTNRGLRERLRIPSGPRQTDSTCGPPGRDKKTASAASQISPIRATT